VHRDVFWRPFLVLFRCAVILLGRAYMSLASNRIGMDR